MKTLLTDDLWSDLSKLAKGRKRIQAAISYVTARHLDFVAGGVLVCDASDRAIKGGLTSAKTLRSFFKRGAEIYSFPGLHSKVAVIDSFALVGSANLSGNAGIGTCEAALLTDDAQIRGLVLGFIERVKSESTRVTAQFLKRIEALPVTKAVFIGGKRTKKITIGQSRVWLVSTEPLSDRISAAEEVFEQKGHLKAQQNIQKKGGESYSIRCTSKTRFRREAKLGDLVIEVNSEKRGKRTTITVSPPVAVLYRQNTKKWTRIYLESAPGDAYYRWRDVKRDFVSLGVTNISPKSTKELTGNALGILQLLK